jgi:lysophospholipid acyltransferase (LPLAT)-like uncharacterized protein
MNDAVETPSSDAGASRRPRKISRAKRLLFAIVASIVAVVIKLAWSTYRFRLDEDRRFLDLFDDKKPVVFAFWHEGIMTAGWYAARIHKRGFPVTFLISPSADGELGTMILARFGSRAVRGSARRSGAAALRGLKRAICEDRQSPFIAIDGSKGPRRYCKPGAMMAARMAGVSIVPIGFAAGNSWRARSWDRHLIPKPGSRVAITVGAPFELERSMDADALEKRRGELEAEVNRLMEISEIRVAVH